MKGKACTVQGPIDPSQLGVTLPHEHLFIDESIYFIVAEESNRKAVARQPLGFENLGSVRFNPDINIDNLRLDDEEMMVKEVMRFKLAGGNTIVDGTPRFGLGRDIEALKRLSIRTGVNVIASAGYYVSLGHPKDMDSRTVDDVKNSIVEEIRDGVGTVRIRPGLIKIATNYPWGRNEEKALEGGARAQSETGAPMEIHPGRNHKHPQMILEVAEKAGADLSHILILHIDRTIEKLEDFKELLDRKCFIDFDLFGQAWYPPQFPLEIPIPSDHIRVQRIKQLIEAGYVDQILMSQDIDTKYLTYSYGGHGYAHILLNIVPLMLHHGISQENLHKLLVDNPRKFFTFR
jgi:phosphotriesterase-related protein